MTTSFNEISLKISDYSFWLYIIGLFYFIVLVGENFKKNLCYFLNSSKFGIKNIFISLIIFISPFLHIDAIVFLKSLGIEEIIIKASEVGLIIIEFIFVIAVGYWYLFLFIITLSVFLIILSISGIFFGAILGNIGILAGTGIVIYWYLPFFIEIIKSLFEFPKEFIECIKKMIKKT